MNSLICIFVPFLVTLFTFHTEIIKNIINWTCFFLDFLGGVILHWNLITSKNQFTNKKSQRKVATLRKNDAFSSCLGINYYTLRPQLGHVHTFDWNANVFVPCASFWYNFGESFFKIELKKSQVWKHFFCQVIAWRFIQIRIATR